MNLALITLLFFLVRAFWAFQGSAMLQKKWVRICPHIIDTLLLLSAIGLVVEIHAYPGFHQWLTAKLLGLVAYILFATLTLKKAKNAQQRALFFFLTLVSFGYIVAVAITKNPLFFL
jgi:uncharacterized membrane protein SirB2